MRIVPPVFLKAGGVAMIATMKRTQLILALLALIIFTAAPRAHAESYEAALQLAKAARWDKALEEFRTLADKGEARSQFSVGLIYHLGRGVKVDYKKAYTWYKKAALQDYAPAINNLGMMYLNGEYVAQNRAIAFKLFKKSSAKHAQAKDNMAKSYENGWGVKKSMKNAIRYYREAGDAGYILGWIHLAELYENGRSVPKNLDEAVKWYIKAAEKNSPTARGALLRLGRLPARLAKK